MSKHDHSACIEHAMAWCRHCDVAYCKNCDITWTRRPVQPWGTTFPWNGGQVNAYQATPTTPPPPGLGADILPPYGLNAQAPLTSGVSPFQHSHGSE